MKTIIFKSFSDFLSRKDKDQNGVSEDFAIRNPNWEKENETNLGCWNCSGCSDCSDCSDCYDCRRCYLSSFSSRCHDCTDCTYCTYCYDCSDCTRCYDCSRCSYLIDKNGSLFKIPKTPIVEIIPEAIELTLSDIEEKLGYKIKIVG